MVIWQVGTNDAVEDVDSDGFRAILERGIDAARRAGTPLILVDPQYFPGASHPKVYANFVGIVDDVGQERGVPVFSRYALMRAWNDESHGLLATMLSKDSFHMSDRGYACWASLLADEIAGRIPTSSRQAGGRRRRSNTGRGEEPVAHAGAGALELPETFHGSLQNQNLREFLSIDSSVGKACNFAGTRERVSGPDGIRSLECGDQCDLTGRRHPDHDAFRRLVVRDEAFSRAASRAPESTDRSTGKDPRRSSSILAIPPRPFPASYRWRGTSCRRGRT